MGEFVSGSSYILGDDYDVDLTNKSEVTGKLIKMSWYNTTTDELITFDELIEEVKTWDGDDVDKKANMLMLLLMASFGETTLPGVGSYKIDFDDPEENEVLEKIHEAKNYIGYGRGAGLLLVFIVGKYLTKKAILRFQNIFKDSVSSEADIVNINEADFGDLNANIEAIGKVNAFKKLEEVVGEEAVGEEVGLLSKLVRLGKVLKRLGWVIAVVVAIVTFILIAKEYGWSAFGFALGAAYAILEIVYYAILVAIACIPVVGWIIVGVIILADFIATQFHHGSGWLMKKLISLFIQVKLRVKLDLEQGETTVNIEDYDDNGLTTGDKLEIKSWFWAKASETGRGKHHGSHHDYRDSYIKPIYEFYPNPSTFDSGSYAPYCVGEDYDTWKLEQCYTGLWIKSKKSMINLPLITRLSSNYKYYYDECCCGICSGKHKTGTTNTDYDTSYFDVLPNDINDFVNWHAISLRDNDGDGILDEVEKGEGGNYYKICAKPSGKC
jgi:hypothetical protein